jgi:hypothetical protein
LQFAKPNCNYQKVLVIVPDNAELEAGVGGWIDSLLNLGRQLNCHYYFRTGEKTSGTIKKQFQISGMPSYLNWEKPGMSLFSKTGDQNYQLIAIINTRPQSVSYSHDFWKLTYRMPKLVLNRNFIMIYPEVKIDNNKNMNDRKYQI